MFDRCSYKAQARARLKGRWLTPIIMSALSLVLLFSALSSAKNMAESESPLFPFFALAIVAAAGILLVSSSKIHLEISRTDGEIPHARIAESVGELWKRGARGGILLALWVFVWSLLFVIPGLVKFVSYSQMFFIMAENKNVGAARAMRMSKAMTDGHKADIALMAMSFLGWIFLSMLTSGIGFLWLCPYMATSFANAYSAMKIEAIRSGRLLPADFN